MKILLSSLFFAAVLTTAHAAPATVEPSSAPEEISPDKKKTEGEEAPKVKLLPRAITKNIGRKFEKQAREMSPEERKLWIKFTKREYDKRNRSYLDILPEIRDKFDLSELYEDGTEVGIFYDEGSCVFFVRDEDGASTDYGIHHKFLFKSPEEYIVPSYKVSPKIVGKEDCFFVRLPIDQNLTAEELVIIDTLDKCLNSVYMTQYGGPLPEITMKTLMSNKLNGRILDLGHRVFPKRSPLYDLTRQERDEINKHERTMSEIFSRTKEGKFPGKTPAERKKYLEASFMADYIPRYKDVNEMKRHHPRLTKGKTDLENEFCMKFFGYHVTVSELIKEGALTSISGGCAGEFYCKVIGYIEIGSKQKLGGRRLMELIKSSSVKQQNMRTLELSTLSIPWAKTVTPKMAETTIDKIVNLRMHERLLSYFGPWLEEIWERQILPEYGIKSTENSENAEKMTPLQESIFARYKTSMKYGRRIQKDCGFNDKLPKSMAHKGSLQSALETNSKQKTGDLYGHGYTAQQNASEQEEPVAEETHENPDSGEVPDIYPNDEWDVPPTESTTPRPSTPTTQFTGLREIPAIPGEEGQGSRVPVVLDWNGDGLPDILVAANWRLWYYQNKGSKNSPQYAEPVELKDSNDLPLMADGITLANLPGKSQPCLIAHNNSKRLDIYQIQTTAEGHRSLEKDGRIRNEKGEFFETDYQSFSFGDFYNDGDIALIMGAPYGILVYKNAGTKEVPQFKIGDEHPVRISYNLSPCLADINYDGRADLVHGINWGHLSYYINEGTGTLSDGKKKGTFSHEWDKTLSEENKKGFRESFPVMHDLNGDGVLDLIIGTKLDGRVLVGFGLSGEQA